MNTEPRANEFQDEHDGIFSRLGRAALTGVACLEYSAGVILAAGGVGFAALSIAGGYFSETVAYAGAGAFLAGCFLMGHAESYM